MNRLMTLCFLLGLSVIAQAQIKLKKIDHQFRYPDMTNYDVMVLDAMMFDNKVNCQDTLREVKELTGSFTSPSFRLKKYETSYYANGNKKQMIFSQGTQGFAAGSTAAIKPSQRLSYSYSTTKGQPDTTLFEAWDATNSRWNFSSKSLYYKSQNSKDSIIRSFNISGQELTNTRYFYTKDGKDSMIVRKTSSTGQTTDSTFYQYDSQRRMILHKQLIYNTTTKVFYIQLEKKWQYDNTKLLSYYKTAYTSGTTPYYIDSTITHIYTGNNLSVTEEKYIQRNAQTSALMDSTLERSRYMTFNAANKPLTIEMDEWDYTNSKWKRMGNIVNEYQADTLIKKETRTEIGIRTGIYTYDEFKIYTYENCQSVTSSVHDRVEVLPFTIAPNPANSYIKIQLEEDNNESAQLTIYNLQGGVMRTQQLRDVQTAVDISQLPRGMYLVKIQQGNRADVKKVTLF